MKRTKKNRQADCLQTGKSERTAANAAKCANGYGQEKTGSDFKLDVDCVIMALGTSPNPLIKSTTAGLETQKWGGIIAEEATGLTSREGVYAGGDAVTGAATVISAMGAGKAAAAAMDAYIKGKEA